MALSGWKNNLRERWVSRQTADKASGLIHTKFDVTSYRLFNAGTAPPTYVVSGIRNKSTSLTQPNSQAKIDWNNPITKGLVIACIPVGSSFVNIVNGEAGVPTGQAARISAKPGIGNAFSGQYYTFIKSNIGANTQDHSQFVLTRFNGASNANSSITGLNAEASWYLDSNLTGAYLSSPSTIDLALGYNLTSGAYQTNAYTRVGSSGSSISYLDGVQKNTVTFGLTYSANPSYTIGQGQAAEFYNSDCFITLFWNRVLSSNEIVSLTNNPFQIFARSTLLLTSSLASAGITGTLSAKNINDSVSSSGTVTDTGSLSTTNKNDYSTSTGVLTDVGALSTTNKNDYSTSSGTVTIQGTLAKNNANDYLSASGSPIVVGTLSKANNNDYLVSSGTVTIVGSLSKANNNDYATATGVLTDVGSSSARNTNDYLTAAGVLTNVGTLNYSNINDNGLAAGSVGLTTFGTVNYTNNNDLITASGTITIPGTLSKNNINDNGLASGTITISGSLAKNNNNDYLTANGTITITGSLSSNIKDDSLLASGTAGTVTTTGTLSANMGNDYAIAIGITPNETVRFSGSGYPHKDLYGRKQAKELNKEIDQAIEAIVSNESFTIAKELTSEIATNNILIADYKNPIIERVTRLKEEMNARQLRKYNDNIVKYHRQVEIIEENNKKLEFIKKYHTHARLLLL